MYIGIDLGTSGVKLLLMGANGAVLRIVTKEYPLYFPKLGWSEQLPEDWLRQSLAGMRELLEGYDAGQVAGISFGGQMHGLVMLDREDRVIRPAILWNDGRADAEVIFLNQTIGKEHLSQHTANIAFAGFTAPKLLWVKNHEPECFARIDKIMLPKDYLAYMLTGVHCTDVSDASGTLLFDVCNKCWSREMLRICGIRDSQMPRVFKSYEAVGTIKREIATLLGIPSNVIVAAGAGDNAAAAIGTGTVGNGTCNISLGTSGTIFISSDKPLVDPNHAIHTFAHADGGYHLLACMLSAASCNKWWMEQILKTKKYESEQAYIQNLGHNRVFFLPYLMGERSPHNDPNACGTLVGMTMNTTRADLTQAILEGVIFGLRDSLEVARSLGLQISASKICGGGAKSPIWLTMAANILNLEIQLLAQEEGPAFGGALLAAVACGAYPSIKSAAQKMSKVKKVIEPDQELTALYDARYQSFRQFYPALKNCFANANAN